MDDALFALLAEAAHLGASDLHLAPGRAPMARCHGALRAVAATPLAAAEVQRLSGAVLSPAELQQLTATGDLDVSFSLPLGRRVRASMFRRLGEIAAVFRLIPQRPPSLSELRLPTAVADCATLRNGLVLVTGATGSGKSTTLAALVDRILATRPVHVVTIEDPIEFLHVAQLGVVSQRQIGSDTQSFAAALRHVLRQDPDVILVGEMRDRETIEAALTLAETGHLVLSTLHSNSAIETMDRLVDAFAAEQQPQVRSQLASVLRLVFAQQLLPRADGSGRVVASEVLLPTAAVRRLLRDGKTHQIANHLQAGPRPPGVRRLAESLAELVREGSITAAQAQQALGGSGNDAAAAEEHSTQRGAGACLP